MRRHPKKLLAGISVLPAAILVLAATIPAVTSFQADTASAGSAQLPPPSFPDAALSSIPVPANCTPPSELPPKQGASMAYAPGPRSNRTGRYGLGIPTYANARGEGHDIVLFGGKGTLGLSNETWAFNGSTWKELHPKTSPPPREGASFVYDKAARADILFGGVGATGLLSDTWAWNGNNWKELYPAISPSPRYDAAAAYGHLGRVAQQPHGHNTATLNHPGFGAHFVF
jgi:hypothetical protein